MGKSANLSEEAYELLQINKLSPNESLSDVIRRLVPRPIRTFGDLEKHLEALDSSGVLEKFDLEGMERMIARKQKANRAG